MPFPGMTNRTELEMYPAVLSEFEHIYAQLQGFLTQAGFSSAGGFSVTSPDTTNVTGASVFDCSDGDIPDGWLECNGQAVSREVYRRLFNRIRVLWGAGDGATTFNVPDFRRRFPAGATGADTIGATGGSWDHTHTDPAPAAATLPALTITGATATAAPNVDLTGNVTNVTPSGGGGTDVVNADTYAVDSHDHGVGTLAIASGQGSHSHASGGATGTANPPHAFGRWLIKT
jgi:microcystin-dependent protein